MRLFRFGFVPEPAFRRLLACLHVAFVFFELFKFMRVIIGHDHNNPKDIVIIIKVIKTKIKIRKKIIIII